MVGDGRCWFLGFLEGNASILIRDLNGFSSCAALIATIASF